MALDFDNDDKLSAVDLREVILRLTTSVVESSVTGGDPRVECLEERDVNKLIEKVAHAHVCVFTHKTCRPIKLQPRSWFRFVQLIHREILLCTVVKIPSCLYCVRHHVADYYGQVFNV